MISVYVFQSTHPRGVRQLAHSLCCSVGLVSIHAPTRGATKMVCRVDYRGCFNPRTHEGCDSGDAMPDIKAIGFNPRTHEGCDRDNRIGNHLAVVSIHAPTRGATELSWKQLIALMFQSTHPRGVRHRQPRRGSRRVCFNPRTHEGCDTLSSLTRVASCCFNPRTHEGCDCCALNVFLRILSFNPRTHEGCDHGWRAVYQYVVVSIHAPTRGATECASMFQSDSLFQSTHPRGVRQATCRRYRPRL